MKYRCIATSPEGFVQQLVSAYLSHGYWFYVSGIIPLGKRSESVDEKLMSKYGVDISRSSRSRRKAAGHANVHYLRYRHRFLLLATHGRHAFFADEQKNVRDARRVPIRFTGYSISVKRGNYLRRSDSGMAEPDGKWRVRVQIDRKQYATLKAHFIDIARQRTVEHLARELYCVPFEPYAPVRQQLLNILRLVNKKRKEAGLKALSPKVLRYQRRIVRPFDNDEMEAA